MGKKTKVLVGLSGGVDSAVAAYILKMSGYEVIGTHLLFPTYTLNSESRLKRAEDLANKLGIPLIICDCKAHFHENVVKYFVNSYLQGSTPNPCIKCNETTKFKLLFDLAKENGLDLIATGHYVRTKVKDGHCYLLRGVDPKKDQSYYLSRLNQETLRMCIFPLGVLEKVAVKNMAREFGILDLAGEDSQEVCFLGDRDYRELLYNYTRHCGPGHIVDERGNTLGTHPGIHLFTIGQRKGIGLSSPEPYYVKEIIPSKNQVVVSRKPGLYSREAYLQDLVWLIPKRHIRSGIRLMAQVRYKQEPSWGTLYLTNNGPMFSFDKPQWAITPGQGLVAYRCSVLIAAGWIRKKDSCDDAF